MFIILSTIPLIPIPSSNNSSIPVPTGANLKVMNFNLHFGVEIDVGYTLEGFKDVILINKPNIVAFQEVTIISPINGFVPMFSDLKNMMAEIGFTYYYLQKEGDNYLRNAVFSQFEILEEKTMIFDTRFIYIRSVLNILININNVNTRVFVTHLTHLPENRSGEERINQVKSLVKYIKSYDLSNTNIILAGDFNSIPDYPEIALLTSFLVDGWNKTNPDKEGYTWPSDNLEKRIDYLFFNSRISVNRCSTPFSTVSDHLPVLCEITIS